MRGQHCTGMIAVMMGLGLTMSAAAQQPSTGAAPAKGAVPAEKMTLTGCIERADQVAARETLGTTVDSLTFVLITPGTGTAAPTADAASVRTPVGTSGTSGTGPGDEARMYRLDGSIDMLNPHVGHRVEIAGTMASRPDTPAGGAPVAGAMGLLRVDSVKMVSSTCAK